MDGCKYGKTRWLTALASVALLTLATTEARADWLEGILAPAEAGVSAGPTKGIVCFVAHGSVRQPKVSQGRENWQAIVQGMQSEWESLKREAVATAVTMFFIRGGTPPGTPTNTGGNATPPGQQNTPPGNGNLPPPGGNGETPPGDPGNPPTGTPEPASFVMALLGAGLAAGCGWRRRSSRKN